MTWGRPHQSNGRSHVQRQRFFVSVDEKSRNCQLEFYRKTGRQSRALPHNFARSLSRASCASLRTSGLLSFNNGSM
jgi:hypothetical protein